MLSQETTYTTHEIARICDVYPTTVISWIKQNKIKAYVTPGGHRRVLRSDLVTFLKQFHLPIPPELRSKRKQLLVVEDDEAVGRLLCKAFRKHAELVDVSWTKDGIGALLALGNNPPDLLVLDVVMPVVDGARVLASLRSDPQTRRIAVVGMTGRRLSPDKLRFMKKHCDAFFIKPFDIIKFTDKTMSLLGVASPASRP